MWVYCYDRLQVGEIGFLVDIYLESCRHSEVRIEKHPSAQNMSGQRILRGWCGSTNGNNRDACGMAEVVEVSGLDDYRVRVSKIADDDPRVVALCDELGVAIGA